MIKDSTHRSCGQPWCYLFSALVVGMFILATNTCAQEIPEDRTGGLGSDPNAFARKAFQADFSNPGSDLRSQISPNTSYQRIESNEDRIQQDSSVDAQKSTADSASGSQANSGFTSLSYQSFAGIGVFVLVTSGLLFWRRIRTTIEPLVGSSNAGSGPPDAGGISWLSSTLNTVIRGGRRRRDARRSRIPGLSIKAPPVEADKEPKANQQRT